MTEILFGGIEEYGIEVGIDENGMLYEAENHLDGDVVKRWK